MQEWRTSESLEKRFYDDTDLQEMLANDEFRFTDKYTYDSRRQHSIIPEKRGEEEDLETVLSVVKSRYSDRALKEDDFHSRA